MGLLDLLKTQGSKLSYNGATLKPGPDGNKASTLHFKSSINNDPALGAKMPPASVLDLNAKIPTISTNPGSKQKLPYIANEPK